MITWDQVMLVQLAAQFFNYFQLINVFNILIIILKFSIIKKIQHYVCFKLIHCQNRHIIHYHKMYILRNRPFLTIRLHLNPVMLTFSDITLINTFLFFSLSNLTVEIEHYMSFTIASRYYIFPCMFPCAHNIFIPRSPADIERQIDAVTYISKVTLL